MTVARLFEVRGFYFFVRGSIKKLRKPFTGSAIHCDGINFAGDFCGEAQSRQGKAPAVNPSRAR
jgi:hypothetical protein